MSKKERNEIVLMILLSLGVYLVGIFRIPLMEVDSSGYAAISQEMFASKNFFEVKNYGQDYLDKPPFLFWSSCFSFLIFGITDWAFRIPSFLFTLLGLFSIFHLGRLLYDERKAWYAVLIQVTCLASFLISHDVRTDTILLNAIIFAVWQLMEYIMGQRRIYNLVLGFIGIGIAMLEKGPIGFMVPAIAILSWVFFQRSWKLLASPAWLLGLLVTSTLLVPMCIGLYQQYGWNGIRFYFWTQSFGRITGASSWSNDTDPFYFLHTFLWSYLPWSFLAVSAFSYQIIQAFRLRFRMDANTIMPVVIIFFVFAGMSLSHYKLPHYIYVAFPFISLATADWCTGYLSHGNRIFRVVYISNYIFFGLLLISLIFIVSYAFPECSHEIIWIVILSLLPLAVLIMISQGCTTRLMMSGAGLMIVVNLLLNLVFYPRLLQFQSGKPAAVFLERTKTPPESVFVLKIQPNSFLFYGKHQFPTIQMAQMDSVLQKYNRIWLYTSERGLQSLRESSHKVVFYQQFAHFPVSMLSIGFLNPETRSGVIKNRYLVRVQ